MELALGLVAYDLVAWSAFERVGVIVTAVAGLIIRLGLGQTQTKVVNAPLRFAS